MATATTGWKCTHSASVTSETNTTANIRVYAYWQNDGWEYEVNSINAYVYCNGVEKQVMSSGSVNNNTSDNSNTYARTTLGYYDFTINKTTSAQSISCYAKIDSNSTYAGDYTRSSTAANVTVSAKPSYTVTFNANGGSGAPSAQTKWYGTTLTLSSTKPTRSGYTFVGWGTSATDTTADYSAGGSYTANASDTLYAIWKKTITLTYNANGGSGAPSAQSATVYNATTSYKFTLSSTKPTRTGYTFLGWSTSSTATSSSYSAGGTITLSTSDTLYAVWSENALTVNYYSNYATYAAFKGEEVSVSSTTNVLVHSQQFYYDNAASSSLADVQNTEYVYISRTGYTPTGHWGTSTSGGTLIDQSTTYSTGQALAQALGKTLASGNASINLYPQWEINEYTIVYNANGGSGSMSNQTVEWQETFTLSNNTFKREGYKFIGWNSYRNLDNKWYVNGQGWLTEDEILAGGYEKKLYENQDEMTFDMSWIRGDESSIHQYTMYAIWEISGVVYIDNGTAFEPYLAYIDNGTDWELYLAYVDDGANWNIIS